MSKYVDCIFIALIISVTLCTVIAYDATQELEPEPTTMSVTTVPETAPTEPITEPTVVTEPVESCPWTDDELNTVCRVVMAEAGGESYEGQMAVAQCILNACLKHDMSPAEAVIAYSYTSHRPEPSESVKEAVEAVFIRGEKAVDANILYFYAPALCTSDWHESQTYVCTIGAHRFFEER